MVQWTAALLDLIRSLLVEGLDEESRNSLMALDERARFELFRLAEAETVLVPFVHTIEHAGLGDFIPPSVRTVVDERIARRKELDRERRRFASLLARFEIEAAFLKGESFQRAYPEGHLRQYGDLDVAVPDINSFWKCSDLLMQDGYVVANLVLRQDPISMAWTGNGALLKPFDAQRQTCLQFDFIIGAMHTFRGFAAPLDRMFWESLEMAPGEAHVHTPNGAQAFLIFLYGLAERHELEIRDAIDCAWLATRLNQEQRQEVRRVAQALSLENDLHRVVASSLALYSNHSEVVVALQRLNDGATRTLASRLRVRLLRMFFGHAVPLSLSQYGTINGWSFAALSLASEILALLRAVERPTVRGPLSTILRKLSASQSIKRGLPFQFVRVAEEPRGAIAWSSANEEEVLVTPIGLFAPAPYGLLFEDRMAKIRAHFVEIKLKRRYM